MVVIVPAYLIRALDWTESHSAAVQALSAIVVAILTAFLVWFTRRYVMATEKALQLSRDQLDVLRNQVDEQKRALNQSIEQYERASLEAHRVDLNEKILQPLRESLSSEYQEPKFSVGFSPVMHYDPQAPAKSNPIKAGVKLEFSEVTNSDEVLDIALLEDARQRHYRGLLSKLESFRASWIAHRDRRRKWLDQMADRILAESQLPRHPTGTNDPYVMHLDLALFVYYRLFQREPTSLSILDAQPNYSTLMQSGGRNFAKGTNEQMKKLLDLIDSMLESERQHARDLGEEFPKLESERKGILREFSVAISTKNLLEKCPVIGLK